MKTYIGSVGPRGNDVVIQEGTKIRPLDPCFDIRNHSPDGFNWGYGGSGPAQLALALMCDLYDKPRREEALRALHPISYHDFKSGFVALLAQGKGWMVSEDSLREVVAEIAERKSVKP